MKFFPWKSCRFENSIHTVKENIKLSWENETREKQRESCPLSRVQLMLNIDNNSLTQIQPLKINPGCYTSQNDFNTRFQKYQSDGASLFCLSLATILQFSKLLFSYFLLLRDIYLTIIHRSGGGYLPTHKAAR